MESEIMEVAEFAMQQPGVSGYICVDKQGLCLAAKGEVSQSMSGIIHQLATLTEKIEEPERKQDNQTAREKPVISVDLERCRMLIKSHGDITTALISPPK